MNRASLGVSSAFEFGGLLFNAVSFVDSCEEDGRLSSIPAPWGCREPIVTKECPGDVKIPLYCFYLAPYSDASGFERTDNGI